MITKFMAMVMFTLILLNGCGKKDENSQIKQGEQIGERKVLSNIINLKTTDHQVIKLTALENGIEFEKYRGKIVLLSFFATWCPPCRTEIPHLNAIQKIYKDDLQIIAILMEESKSNAEITAFIQDYQMGYPVTNSPENFLLSDALGGIRSLPTLVIYDRHGEYSTHFVGAAPQEMIEAEIKKAMAK